MAEDSSRRIATVGVVVAVVAVIAAFTAGFVLGAFPTSVNGGVVGQNYVSVTQVNTIYDAAGIHVDLVAAEKPASSGCASGTQPTVTAAGTVNIYVSGATSLCSNTSMDWYQEVSFTSSTLTGGQSYTDNFTVATTSGATSVTTFDLPVDLATTGTVNVNIFVDSGAASGAPSSYSGFTVVVQGS